MLDIVPYRSVGDIVFGSTSAELTDIAGEPESIGKNRDGELDYQYDGFSVRLSSKEQKVVEVGLTPQPGVRLGDVDIFTAPSAFERLIAKDGTPFEFVGFIILLNLGITLTGFHDNDESQKAVTAFEKGRWDELRSEFKAFVQSSPEA